MCTIDSSKNRNKSNYCTTVHVTLETLQMEGVVDNFSPKRISISVLSDFIIQLEHYKINFAPIRSLKTNVLLASGVTKVLKMGA